MKPFLLNLTALAPLSLHMTPVLPSAAGQQLGGTVVPGVCLLSRAAVFEHSRVGLAATQRLQQLAQQVQAEIEADRQPIETDRKAYQTDAGKLTAEQRQAREQALGQRIQLLQQKAALRDREIEATRNKAQARIASEMQPVVQQAYQAKSCGLLLDRNAVLGGDMANDLTPAVVQGLDARISTLSFDLEVLTAPASPVTKP